MRRILLLFAFVFVCASVSNAQDPVKVDAKHYKVVSENDKVRILRIHYGAKEKSVMHEHPDAVAIFLSDSKVKFNLPDGTSQDSTGKAGDSIFMPGGKHNPENVGDKAFDAILVELKGHSMPPPPAAKSPAKKKS
ncbi:MAG: cytoplasmic protein [Acidobacteria bacterium]|nr:cytoplasmic protein [Acidobacteriota bacterium]